MRFERGCQVVKLTYTYLEYVRNTFGVVKNADGTVNYIASALSAIASFYRA